MKHILVRIPSAIVASRSKPTTTAVAAITGGDIPPIKAEDVTNTTPVGHLMSMCERAPVYPEAYNSLTSIVESYNPSSVVTGDCLSDISKFKLTCYPSVSTYVDNLGTYSKYTTLIGV